jgi:hypothetical protein
MDEETFRNLNRRLAAAGLVMMSLEHFSSVILAHAVRAHAIDPESIATYKAQVITELKNYDAAGISLHEERELFREAIESLEHLLNSAISRARDG